MEILNVFGMVFDWLMDVSVFGIPVLVLFLGIALLGLVVNFIKGDRK